MPIARSAPTAVSAIEIALWDIAGQVAGGRAGPAQLGRRQRVQRHRALLGDQLAAHVLAVARVDEDLHVHDHPARRLQHDDLREKNRLRGSRGPLFRGERSQWRQARQEEEQ